MSDISSATSKSPIKPPILASTSPSSSPSPTAGANARKTDITEEPYDAKNIPLGVLILSNPDIHTISRILGLNILTVDDLIRSCSRLTQMKVGGVNIQLDPGLIERLYSRCGTHQEFTEYLSYEVKKMLHGFVGY